MVEKPACSPSVAAGSPRGCRGYFLFDTRSFKCFCATCAELVSSYYKGVGVAEQDCYHDEVDISIPAVRCLAMGALRGCSLCTLVHNALLTTEYELLRPGVREGSRQWKMSHGKLKVSTSLRKKMLCARRVMFLVL
jgi:hypothetical protein